MEAVCIKMDAKDAKTITKMKVYLVKEAKMVMGFMIVTDIKAILEKLEVTKITLVKIFLILKTMTLIKATEIH